MRVNHVRRAVFYIAISALTLLLYGCDDLEILYLYNKSNVQKDIENGIYKTGDAIRIDKEAIEFCLIPPYTETIIFDQNAKNSLFSSVFWMAITTYRDGGRKIAWIHESWLQTPNEDKICVIPPAQIVVKSIIDRAIFVEHSRR